MLAGDDQPKYLPMEARIVGRERARVRARVRACVRVRLWDGASGRWAGGGIG